MRNRAESRMRSSPRRRAQVHRRSSKRRNTRTTAHMRNHIHILHRIDGTGTGDPDLKRYARAGPVPWPCGARCERGARSCGLSPLLTDPRPRSRKSRGASSALSPPPPLQSVSASSHLVSAQELWWRRAHALSTPLEHRTDVRVIVHASLMRVLSFTADCCHVRAPQSGYSNKYYLLRLGSRAQPDGMATIWGLSHPFWHQLALDGLVVGRVGAEEPLL